MAEEPLQAVSESYHVPDACRTVDGNLSIRMVIYDNRGICTIGYITVEPTNERFEFWLWWYLRSRDPKHSPMNFRHVDRLELEAEYNSIRALHEPPMFDWFAVLASLPLSDH